MLRIPGELLRILNRILLLHKRRRAAVLKVIAALLAHIMVLNPAKIEPNLGKLMNKKRTGVKILVPKVIFPLKTRGPGLIAFLG